MKRNKIILIILILSIIALVFSGCGGGNPVIPPIDNDDDSDSEDIGLIEVISGEIDLEEGGVIEVTDESSEIYGTRVIVESIDKMGKSKDNYVTITIFLKNIFEGDWTIGDYQGFLVSPVKVDALIILPRITLELPYNEHKLSNAGVSKNDTPNLYRLNNNHFEKVPENEYSCGNEKIVTTINWGEEGYYSCYTLTVTNCKPPDNLGQPLPGDLVYRLSSRGVNNNWLPGHVGIYVGEKYGDHDKDPSTPDKAYNVIEALLISVSGTGGVQGNHYDPITHFNLDGQASYMGARQLPLSLTHTVRNEIIKFAKEQIGKKYALFNTFGFLIGLANGNRVKTGPKFNCVGLVEAAYESAGLDIVSDYDEGNQFDSPGPDLPNPDAILSPQEQLYRTVPATGLPVLNAPPEISNLKVIPEGSINMNSLVFITCNASDADQDDLTYIWTKPIFENNIDITFTEGKSIVWFTPNKEGIYEISCKVIDNYGGEDKKSLNISVGLEAYTITASAGPNGSISPSGDVSVNEGSDQTFTITPDTGYSINDVLVDESSVGTVSSYTFTDVTEDHTIMATFINEDQYYNTNAHSAHFADGYYVELMINDPNQTAQSVTVSGPGIDGSISLIKGVHPFYPNQWWSNPNVSLGDNPPNLPLVYTFTIIDKIGITCNINDSVQSYVVNFATNLLPEGTQTSGDGLVFSWTGVEIEGVKYKVELSDKNWGRIWNSPLIADTSFTYNGPLLALGDYQYFVCVWDEYGNSSLAGQNFQIKDPLI